MLVTGGTGFVGRRLPLRLAPGDFAQELLLSGQRVLPAAALRSGFVFDHATLETALGATVGNPQPRMRTAPRKSRLPTATPLWRKMS